MSILMRVRLVLWTGGIQLPVQLLFGTVGFLQRSAAALQLEFQTGPDIFELLLILGQRGEVPHGILQILLCVVPLDSQHLGSFFQRRQTAQGRLSSSLGGGLCHLRFGVPGRQGRHLAPQGIPAGTALVVFPGQTHQLIVQGIQLCGQFPARQLHALCHSAVAFQSFSVAVRNSRLLFLM